MQDMKLIMIGAMYENGGNTTHRFLDGHPELFVYPFESQVGTSFVRDYLRSMFPVKYRWPVFPLEGTAYGDYKMIIDEEGKVRARTPRVSKFRHMPFAMNDDERCRLYEQHIGRTGRSRANNMAAFFKATFEAWKDYRRTGREKGWVGYSPIIGVDADKILADFPRGHVIHVVRNPWSAYADHKKRPVPLSLDHYLLGWTLNQQLTLQFARRFPDRLHIVRLEDTLANPLKTLGALCEKLGIARVNSLKIPSWNGRRLKEVYPWGTIRRATPAANLATARELSAAEVAAVRDRAAPFLQPLKYDRFLR